ncbi:hypothetical protein [Actinoplanes sp. CA-252034]|uniref:hypothetical protein n=1 Tax=Actinoplanes sp. CA-252034 TaxID=3239906 RepID=UPI003D9851D0
MRKLIALTFVPALAAAVILTGTAAAGDGGRTPAPAASPPLGDDYYTDREMERGLPRLAQMPEGYTQLSDEEDGYVGLLDTDSCYAEPHNELSGFVPITSVRRAFRNEDGSTIAIQLLAVGHDDVTDWVAETAAPPTECPVVKENGATAVTNTRLPLPDLGHEAAGLIRVFGAESNTPNRRHSAAMAWGPVVLTVEETRTDEHRQERFVDIVAIAARQVDRITDGPSIEELRLGLIGVADLPAGHRLVSDDTIETAQVFTVPKCDGTTESFGDGRLAVRRTFARGDGDATIEVIVGPTELSGVFARALGRCPDTTDLQTPATDLTADGVVYPGPPRRARAVVAYHGVASDVRVTLSGDVSEAEVQKIVEAAMVGILKVV